jgi:hypothetical protein
MAANSLPIVVVGAGAAGIIAAGFAILFRVPQ